MNLQTGDTSPLLQSVPAGVDFVWSDVDWARDSSFALLVGSSPHTTAILAWWGVRAVKLIGATRWQALSNPSHECFCPIPGRTSTNEARFETRSKRLVAPSLVIGAFPPDLRGGSKSAS